MSTLELDYLDEASSDSLSFFENSYAFIIGIDQYKHVPSLDTAVYDASDLATKLAEIHGYEVRTLFGNKEDNELVSAQKLTDFLLSINNDLIGPKDRVLIFFAGHGFAVGDDDNPQGYLVPADAKTGDLQSLVPMDVLYGVLEKLQCNHGLLLLDCCYAGAFRWAQSSGTRDFVGMPNVIYQERLAQFATDPAWQVITSTKSDQKAADFAPDQLKSPWEDFLSKQNENTKQRHSPFATALLAALDGEADRIPSGEKEGDGIIIGTELYLYLQEEVSKTLRDTSMDQLPSMFTLPSHGEGEYIFQHPNHSATLPSKPMRIPHMGLKPYGEDDATLFFGRASQVNELVSHLKEHSLTLLVGKAGSGKTSLVQSALLPMLRSESWGIIQPSFPYKKEAFLAATQQATETEGDLLLVIDEFESVGKQREEIVIEVQSFLSSTPDESHRRKVLVICRSEVEAWGNETYLPDSWQLGRFELSDLDPTRESDELEEIILQPSAQHVMHFETRKLVSDLTDDIKKAHLVLPWLSQVLFKLHEAYFKSHREDRELAEADYRKIGGVAGCIAEQLEEYFASQTPENQETLQRMFMRMIKKEEGKLDTNKILVEDLFPEGLEHFLPEEQAAFIQAEQQRIEKLVVGLLDRRILTTISEVEEGEEVHYLVAAHPQVWAAWPRTQSWATVEEANLKLVSDLRRQVQKVKQGSKAASDSRKYQAQLDQLITKKIPAADLLDRLKDWWKDILEKFDRLRRFIARFDPTNRRSQAQKFLWDKNGQGIEGLKQRLESGRNLFNVWEGRFILASYAQKRRKETRNALYLLGFIGFLLVAVVTTSILRYQAVKAEKEAVAARERAEESEKIAVFQRKQAEKRLAQIYYKDYRRLIDQAEGYIDHSLRKQGYESVFYFLTDSTSLVTHFIADSDSIAKDTLIEDLGNRFAELGNEGKIDTMRKVFAYSQFLKLIKEAEAGHLIGKERCPGYQQVAAFLEANETDFLKKSYEHVPRQQLLKELQQNQAQSGCLESEEEQESNSFFPFSLTTPYTPKAIN